MRLVIALLVGIGASVAATARAEIEIIATEPQSGISIEAEGWTGLGSVSAGRDAGLIPVTVTITNGTDSDHVWNLTPDDRYGGFPGVASSSRIAVPAGSTAKTTLYFGSAGNRGGHSQIRVSGHAVQNWLHVDSRTAEQALSTARSSGRPVSNFPAGLSADALSAFGSQTIDGFTVSGSALDMTRAPEDWRGWCAFRGIMLSEGEWRGLGGGRRKAMLDWITAGGRVAVLVTDPTPGRLEGMGMPIEDADKRRRLGVGEVIVVPWDGKNLSAQAVHALRMDERESTAALLELYQPGSSRGRRNAGWDGGFGRLVSVFGERTLPVGWILGFLTLFGIVAGPVNVMVLAGKGRRSRMFWTTPLISLAATGFLLLLMFMRDGIGGDGARRVLAVLAPEQNTMAIIQEQFSRTGVLLGSSFPVAEPTWLEPIGERDWNETFLEVEGRWRQGDWFRSRSDQAYLATTVRPSRGRIELVDGGNDSMPSVISSIEVPLDQVFVIDDEGRYWTTESVSTGQKKQLRASDADSYDRWFQSLAGDAGPVRRLAMDRARNVRGHAYATSKDARKVAIATLGAIRWIDERVDFLGPFVRSQP